jgi:hypothetical protein
MFLQTKSKYISGLVHGTCGHVLKGSTATHKAPGEFNPGCFTGDHTVILGSEDHGEAKECCVEWPIPFEPATLGAAEGGFLIVACERNLGGLHTTLIGAKARVSLNGHGRDFIRLENCPLGHNDFFHSDQPNGFLDLPVGNNVDLLRPIRNCKTIYTWPISKDQLIGDKDQVIQISLDPEVLWDIDYLALVLERPTKRLRKWVLTLIWLGVGGILGAIFTRVVEKFLF